MRGTVMETTARGTVMESEDGILDALAVDGEEIWRLNKNACVFARRLIL